MKGGLVALAIVAVVLALAWFAWSRGLFQSVGLAPAAPPPGPTPKEWGPAAPAGGQGFSSVTGTVYGTTYGVVCQGVTAGAGGPLCTSAVQAGNVVGTTIEKGVKGAVNKVRSWF